MAIKQTTLRLHQDIKKDFDKLSNVREFNVQKYSNEYVLHTLAMKYYKSVRTIENIVFNRTNVSATPSNQTSLFTQTPE